MCSDYSRREIGSYDLTPAARVFLIDYFKAAIPQEMDGDTEIKAPRFRCLAFLLFYYFFFLRGNCAEWCAVKLHGASRSAVEITRDGRKIRPVCNIANGCESREQ